MIHEDAALLIPDLHKGRLDSAESAEVREHVAACDECRSVSAAYEALLAASRSGEAHPDPAQLVGFAMSPVQMEAGERGRVEAHSATCASCAREVRAVREAERAPSSMPVKPGGTRSYARWWGALAAGVALVLLADVVRLRWMEPSGIRSSDGMTALTLLTGGTREGSAPPTVEVGASGDPVAIAVAPALPSDLPDATALAIRVVGGDGRDAFAREASAGEIRSLSGASGVFVLLVPAHRLPAGRASLQIETRPGDARLFEAAFDVRR